MNDDEKKALGLGPNARFGEAVALEVSLPKGPQGLGVQAVSRSSVGAAKGKPREKHGEAPPVPPVPPLPSPSPGAAFVGRMLETDHVALAFQELTPKRAVALAAQVYRYDDPTGLAAVVVEPREGTAQFVGPWQPFAAEPGQATVLQVAPPGEKGCMVRLTSPQGDTVLVVGEGGQATALPVLVADAGAEPTATLASEASVPLPALPALPRLPALPPLHALLTDRQGEALPPWLREAFQAERESPSALVQLASVGTLVRFWSPTAEDKDAVWKALLGEPADVPSRKAEAWCASNAAALGALEGDALVEAQALADVFHDLVDGLSRETALRQQQLHELVQRRDRLESLRWVLDRSGAGQALADALRDVDAQACRQSSLLLSEVDLTDDDRARAAGVSNPDAWWGTLAFRDEELA